jgi:lysozyme
MAGVSPGMTITTAQAEQILRDDLHEFERNVSRLVKVDVSANEFSAMVCLSYNIGWGNFGKSTVLRQVNRQHWSEAADAFLMWNKIKGNVSQHLTSRRTIERALFLLP